MPRPRNQIFAALLGTGCLLLHIGCKPAAPSGSSPQASVPTPRKVKLACALPQPMERAVPATGSLLGWNSASISVKVAGRVVEMVADVGSAVQAGGSVARLDPVDYALKVRQAEAALAAARARLGLTPDGMDDRAPIAQTSLVMQAKARLDEAKRNLERGAALHKAKVLPDSELETLRANCDVAEIQWVSAQEEAAQRQAQVTERRVELEIAQQELRDTRILAPFDGVLQERRASPGEFLAAGSPVATLVQVNPLRLRLEIAERDAAEVQVGQSVRVLLEGHHAPYTNQIARVSPSFRGRSRMLTVEADIPNPEGALRAGAFAQAEVVLEANEPALAVPHGALLRFAGIDRAFVNDQGRAREVRLTLGRRTAEFVEVLSGLEPGEFVVVDPKDLKAGDPIVPVDPEFSDVP